MHKSERSPFENIVMAVVPIVSTLIGVPAHSQDAITSAAKFLEICERDFGSCLFYVIGAMEGRIVAEVQAGSKYRHCTPQGGSFGEVSHAYIGYLQTERTKGNNVILNLPNIAAFTNFMDSRYLCR